MTLRPFDFENFRSRGLTTFKCRKKVSMDLIKTKQFLKQRLQKDSTTLYGFSKERAVINNLFKRTAIDGESNSILLISQKYGGKTTVSQLNP